MIDLTPNIILSKPQLGENIGSCARAMKNFGIEKLRLIEPRDGWPNSSAYAISAGADNILDKTKIFKSLIESTKDISLLFATTARKRVIGTKSLNIFDRVVVATTDNVNKSYYFSIEERLDIINNSLFKDLKLNNRKIKVVSFNNLTIDLCKKYNANAIIRGLRAVSDFEYEFQLAGMNKKLNSKIETMFLMSDVENQIISSKFVKEIASLGGNIDRFVTRSTVKILRNKIQ